MVNIRHHALGFIPQKIIHSRTHIHETFQRYCIAHDRKREVRNDKSTLCNRADEYIMSQWTAIEALPVIEVLTDTRTHPPSHTQHTLTLAHPNSHTHTLTHI